MIQAIGSDKFAVAYPHVERFFNSFYARSRGLLEPGHLEAEILAGHRQCYAWVRDGKAVACVLSTLSPGAVISVDYASGDDLKEWPVAFRDMFMGWAEKIDGRIVTTLRPGWVRVMRLEEVGFKRTHVVMELG